MATLKIQERTVTYRKLKDQTMLDMFYRPQVKQHGPLAAIDKFLIDRASRCPSRDTEQSIVGLL